jgi:hypothetical protein
MQFQSVAEARGLGCNVLLGKWYQRQSFRVATLDIALKHGEPEEFPLNCP